MMLYNEFEREVDRLQSEIRALKSEGKYKEAEIKGLDLVYLKVNYYENDRLIIPSVTKKASLNSYVTEYPIRIDGYYLEELLIQPHHLRRNASGYKS